MKSAKRLWFSVFSVAMVILGSPWGIYAQSNSEMSASPSSLTFGSVSVDAASAPQSFRVTNSGSHARTIERVASNNNQFVVSGPSLPLTVDAGQSASFQVVFEPTAVGNSSGTIKVSLNRFSRGAQRVAVSGTAAATTQSQTPTSSPSIASLSPSSGPVGTTVTIAGTDFGGVQGTSTITFNGTPAAASIWTATTIMASVPTGATTGNVSVTVGGVASNAFAFTVTPATSTPSISSLTPTSGAVGTSVTVAGTNFGGVQGSSTITFNGKAATTSIWTATTIMAPVPTGATTGNVIVTVSGVTSNAAVFAVTSANPVPSISSLTPNSGAVAASVTIGGANFGATQGTSTVTFNGTAASPISWSASSIVAPVPTGATTGNIVVNVGGQASNGAGFTVTSPAPSITSLSPSSGAVGTVVTIAGTNFGTTQGASTITFNGTAATPTNWSATSVVAPVPAGATKGNVVMTVGGQASNGSSFTVNATLAGEPTLIQQADGDTSDVHQSVSVYMLPLPQPSLTGNLLIVAATWNTDTITGVLSDNLGTNTWTAGPIVKDTTKVTTAEAWYCSNCNPGTRVFTLTLSSATTYVKMVAAEYSGIASSGALDGSSGIFTASSTTLQPGSFTTTHNGDLIWQWAVCDSGCTTGSSGKFTAQSGLSLVAADTLGVDLQAVQSGIQATAGAIDPTITSPLSFGYISIGMAFETATAGTIPSGIRILSMGHRSTSDETASSRVFQFPCRGTALALAFTSGAGSPMRSISAISDSNGNTWVQPSGSPFVDSENNDVVALWYSLGVNCNADETLTLTMTGTNSGGNGENYMMHDLSGIASFDKLVTLGGDQTATGPFTGVTITPATANGLVLSNASIYYNSATGVSSTVGTAYYLPTVGTCGTGWSVSMHADENNGWGVVFNQSTSAMTFSWNQDNCIETGVHSYATLAASFNGN